MKKRITLYLGSLIILALAIYFAFPPYAFPAYTFWVLHGQEIEKIDRKFVASGEKEWGEAELNLHPVFVSEEGSRIYFIGSLERFGQQYDIAFIKGNKILANCGLFRFYFQDNSECIIKLNNGWSIYYVIHSTNLT